MDRIDQKILDQLEIDSDLTSEALGERVGLSASAAHRRVKALEQAGMVLGYRARLAPAAKGNPSVIFVRVTLVDQCKPTMLAFEEALSRTEHVVEAYLTSGESDYLIKVLLREGDDFRQIHRDVLSVLPGVSRLVSQFTIRTLMGG